MSSIQACPTCGGRMYRGGIQCVSCYKRARKAAAEARHHTDADDDGVMGPRCPYGGVPHPNGYPVDGPCVTHYAALKERGYWAARLAERLREGAS